MTPQLTGCQIAVDGVLRYNLVQATVLMDLHAHLSCAEVIGLLGGTWEPAVRQIRVGPVLAWKSS